MAYIRRQFKGNASYSDALLSGITNGSTAITLKDGTTFPDGSVGPFVVTIDPGNALEEKVLVTTRSGANLQSCTRAYDGTTAQVHAANAIVQHTISAVDLDEANQAAHQLLGGSSTSGQIPYVTGAGTYGFVAAPTTGQLLGYSAGVPGWVANGTYVQPAGSNGSQIVPSKLPFFNVKDYGAKGDGVTDDTAAINAALTADGNAGGGIVFLPAGVYIVDVTNTVGGVPAALVQPSNTRLVGAGEGATIVRLAANASRAPSATAPALVVNATPAGNTDVGLDALTLDGNRLNQGAYAYGPISLAAGANAFGVRAVYYLNCTGVQIPSLRIANLSGQGVFIEGTTTRVKIGRVDSTNSVAAVVVDAATDLTLGSVQAVNTDPAPTINTTSTTAVAGGGSATVTPASMAGIVVGAPLTVALNTGAVEVVLVTAATGSTFTAYFANAHSGTWTIQNAVFASDSALQFGTGCESCAFSSAVVDYSAVLAIFGSAVEILGAKDISGGQIVSRGGWRSLWIHNWTIGGTIYTVEDVTVASAVVTNPVASATGLAPIGVFLDDNGNSSANPARNISIGAISVRYGAGGAATPANSTGLVLNNQIVGATVGSISIQGGTTGISLGGTVGAVIGPFLVSGTTGDGVVLASGASHNTLTGRVTSPGGYGITLTAPVSPTQNAGNVFYVTVDGAGIWPIRLNGGANPSTNINNMFFGDISQNGSVGILTAGVSYNYAKMAGLNPQGHALGTHGQPAVPASGVALVNDTMTDASVMVTGGTVTAVAIGGTATGATSGWFRVPAGQSITLTYTVAPTWSWFGD